MPTATSNARVLFGALVCALTPIAAQSEFRYGVMNIQNDLFVGRDGGGYTNGIFLASVRSASASDMYLDSAALLAPIARTFGVASPSIISFSAGQVIITPRNLRQSEPDPKDAPYVGGFALRAAQIDVHDNRANMVALSLGVIGPAAGAEQTQKTIHRVIGADRPMGWDTQVSNRALVAVERRVARRIASDERVAPGQAARDLVLQGGATLGSLETLVSASLLLRYGVTLEKSFPTTMPLTGRGSDPFLMSEGWFVFGGVSAEHIFHHIGIGEASELRKSKAGLTLGISYGWKDAALTFALKSEDPLLKSSSRRQSYGSLTYAFRLW